MDSHPKPIDLSRIDKLWLDRDGLDPAAARAARAAATAHITVGADVAASYGLQVALLTAVNLAAKCFAAPVVVDMPDGVWEAALLVRLGLAPTVGQAVQALGGRRATPLEGHGAAELLIGDASARPRSLRVTYDGWRVAVGPAAQVARLAERGWCPLAPIAAAAVAVGEVFAAFARVSVTATRRVIGFSLWRPDLAPDAPDSEGIEGWEVPLELSCFGLGHLGQAYLWAVASLPYDDLSATRLQLYDDDGIEPPNLETGALLNSQSKGRKTREVAKWLEARGFGTRLVERFIDGQYRRHARDPVVALCGFDDNEARQWLSRAGFGLIFDSGLGGDYGNFDSIAVRSWPNRRPAEALWPVETREQRRAREERLAGLAQQNDGYAAVAPDECGRVLVANKSVAVPFVGAVASAFVLAEMLRAVNGGPTFDEIRLKACALSHRPLTASLRTLQAPAVSAVPTRALRLR